VTVTIIDLGLILPEEPVEIESPPRPRRRGRGRVSLLIAAIVLMVAGSARPALSGVTVAARIPIGASARMLIQGTTAILVDRRDQRNELAAYDLESGRSRWRSTLDGDVLNAEMFLDGSTVVVVTDGDGDGDLAEGFALSTGVRRWILQATTVTSIPAGLLVYQQNFRTTFAELVDPLTGRSRWHTTISDDCDVYLATDRSQTMSSGLLEVCQASKEIAALDLASGRVRAHVHTDLFPVQSALGRSRRLTNTPIRRGAPRLTVVYLGDVAVVTVPSRFPARTLAAFRTSDLALLWSGVAAISQNNVSSCGTDLCVDTGVGVVALDRQTGRRVPPPASASDPEPVTSPLVVVAPGQPSTSTVTPVEQGDAVPLAGPGPGSTWIEVRDGTEVRPVEMLRGIGDASCSVIAAYVACATRTDQLTVWRKS
jgi:outer membrane protein assembly factor BamB